MTSSDLAGTADGRPTTPAPSASLEWGGGVDALAGGASQPLARFRFDVVTGSWWWSEGMYALHGFAPGEVVPSTELLLAHKHEDDRARTAESLRAVLADGEPFCCRHRIVDAAGLTRTVLSLGEGSRDESGAVTSVHGYFVDVTVSLRRDIADEAHEAVERSAQTRAVLEQAKGILIVVYGVDADAAFELLRWHSQHRNTKVRLLAAGLVQQFAAASAVAGVSPQRRASSYLGSVPALPAGTGADGTG